MARFSDSKSISNIDATVSSLLLTLDSELSRGSHALRVEISVDSVAKHNGDLGREYKLRYGTSILHPIFSK
jgi:hypothetical protein